VLWLQYMFRLDLIWLAGGSATHVAFFVLVEDDQDPLAPPWTAEGGVLARLGRAEDISTGVLFRPGMTRTLRLGRSWVLARQPQRPVARVACTDGGCVAAVLDTQSGVGRPPNAAELTMLLQLRLE
jgi:hypothetical protein